MCSPVNKSKSAGRQPFQEIAAEKRRRHARYAGRSCRMLTYQLAYFRVHTGWGWCCGWFKTGWWFKLMAQPPLGNSNRPHLL
jgi:hypothetical protein